MIKMFKSTYNTYTYWASQQGEDQDLWVPKHHWVTTDSLWLQKDGELVLFNGISTVGQKHPRHDPHPWYMDNTVMKQKQKCHEIRAVALI